MSSNQSELDDNERKLSNGISVEEALKLMSAVNTYLNNPNPDNENLFLNAFALTLSKEQERNIAIDVNFQSTSEESRTGREFNESDDNEEVEFVSKLLLERANNDDLNSAISELIEIERKKVNSLVESALEPLEEIDRLIFHLRFRYSMSYREIAEQLQLPIEDAHKRLQVIQRKLYTMYKTDNRMSQLLAAIQLLSAVNRSMIILRFQQNLSPKEISEQLNLPTEDVIELLTTTQRKLRRLMNVT